MSGAGKAGLLAHAAGGATTICRAWALTRGDGTVLGFTDHDLDLEFEGFRFRAGTGLSAAALMQTTGLSVDNTEATGALSDAAITEADLSAGRYDGADLRAWLVNWAAPEERMEIFRGTLGEIRRGAGAFHAELRGLTQALNQPQGRIYQADCTAVLGDAACRVDLDAAGYSLRLPAEAVEDARVFRFDGLTGFDAGWFARGRLIVESGAAEGLAGVIRDDRRDADGLRRLSLWQPLAGAVASGDRLRLVAGCDKRPETCRLKFHNFNNFRGFPHIPGEDWLMAVQARAGAKDGGSLR